MGKNLDIRDVVRIAICDRNKKSTNSLTYMIDNIAQDLGSNVVVLHYKNSRDLLQCVTKGEYIDIILMEIDVDPIDGIEAGRLIRTIPHMRRSLLIYMSQFKKYYKDAINNQAFNYLLKPIDCDIFREICFKAFRALEEPYHFFTFVFKHMHYKLHIDQIIYFESNGRKISVVTDRSSFEFYGRLSSIAEQLKSSFLYVHKSYLVNFSHIIAMNSSYCIMSNQMQVSISAKKSKDMYRYYLLYWEKFNIDKPVSCESRVEKSGKR